LKNSHWAICSGIFTNRDIGSVERNFLLVLDWELTIGESDVLAHRDALRVTAAHQLRKRVTVDDHASLEKVSQMRRRSSCCPSESPVSYWSDSDDGSSSLPQTPHTVETFSNGLQSQDDSYCLMLVRSRHLKNLSAMFQQFDSALQSDRGGEYRLL
jgi:hypothetical protein